MKKADLMKVLCAESNLLQSVGFRCRTSKFYFQCDEGEISKRVLVMCQFPTSTSGLYFTIQLASTHSAISELRCDAWGIRGADRASNFCVRFPLELLDPNHTIEQSMRYFQLSLATKKDDISLFESRMEEFGIPFFSEFKDLNSIIEFCRLEESSRLIGEDCEINLLIATYLVDDFPSFIAYRDVAVKRYENAPRVLKRIGDVIATISRRWGRRIDWPIH